jgi:hypothetical protein
MKKSQNFYRFWSIFYPHVIHRCICQNILTRRECNNTFTYTLYDKYKIHIYTSRPHIIDRLSTSVDNFAITLGILRWMPIFPGIVGGFPYFLSYMPYFFMEFPINMPKFLTFTRVLGSGPLHLIYF